MAVLKNTKFSSKSKKNFNSKSRKNRLMSKMRGGMGKKLVVLGSTEIKKLSIFTKEGGILLNKLYTENNLLNKTLHSVNNLALGNEYISQPKLLSAIDTEKLKLFFDYKEIIDALPDICGSELAIILDGLADFESSKFSNVDILEKFYKTQLNKYNESMQLQEHFKKDIDSLVQNSLDNMVHSKIDKNKYKPEQISRLQSYSSDKSMSNSKYPKLTLNSIKQFLESVKNDLEIKQEKKKEEEAEKKRLIETFRPRSTVITKRPITRKKSGNSVLVNRTSSKKKSEEKKPFFMTSNTLSSALSGLKKHPPVPNTSSSKKNSKDQRGFFISSNNLLTARSGLKKFTTRLTSSNPNSSRSESRQESRQEPKKSKIPPATKPKPARTSVA